MSHNLDRLKKMSFSLRAMLWLGREYGTFRLNSGSCPLRWYVAEDGTVDVQAHGSVVRSMHADGFLYPVAEGLFALTPKGAGLAEGLLCEPLGLRRAETKTVEPFWLSDAQMDRISKCFPQYSGEARKDDRAVMSGIVHVLRTGIAWGRAPACYGKSIRLFHRFRQWAVAGVLDQVLSNLLEPSDGRMTLVIDDVVLLSHRTGRTYAARGYFSILAPVEDMPCAT